MRSSMDKVDWPELGVGEAIRTRRRGGHQDATSASCRHSRSGSLVSLASIRL
jgi:hypothetical protein